jgi:hypothetical protein
VNLTKRQKELLKEFDGAGGGHSKHQPEHHGFFARVKEFWEDLTELRFRSTTLLTVIARREATKQSRLSQVSGLPRRFAPRNDG